MAKYEVIVREYDEDGHMTKETAMGAEDGLYDGVLVMGHMEDKDKLDSTTILNLTHVDMAVMIASDDEVIQSAILAEAMTRARRIGRERKTGATLEAIFGGRAKS